MHQIKPEGIKKKTSRNCGYINWGQMTIYTVMLFIGVDVLQMNK